MKRSHFFVCVALRWLLVSAFVAPSTLVAADQVLFEHDLTADGLLLEVQHADIQVFIDGAEERPFLVVSAAEKAPIDAQSVTFDQSAQQAHLQRSLPSSTKQPPRLNINVVLRPQVALRVVGEDLRVQVETIAADPLADPGATSQNSAAANGRNPDLNDPDETSPEPTQENSQSKDPPNTVTAEEETVQATTGNWAATHGLLEFIVVRSEVALWGAQGFRFEGNRSNLQTENTSGNADLQLQDTVAELTGHQGDIKVSGTKSQLTTDDVHGSLLLDWRQGDLVIQGGSGEISGQIAESLAQLTDWRGTLELAGSSSTLQSSGSKGIGKGARMQGTDFHLTFDRWIGPLHASLNGGSLRGVEWRGKTVVSGRQGTEIDILRLQGQVDLTLRQNSGGRIAGIVGGLKANVQGSQLEIEDCRRLDLRTFEAEVTARQIENLAQISLISSDVQLDFATLKSRRGTILARQGSRVEVTVPSPCMVQLRGATSLNQVSVSGCEVRKQGEGRRKFSPRSADGNRMMQLIIEATTDAEVDVEGAG